MANKREISTAVTIRYVRISTEDQVLACSPSPNRPPKLDSNASGYEAPENSHADTIIDGEKWLTVNPNFNL